MSTAGSVKWLVFARTIYIYIYIRCLYGSVGQDHIYIQCLYGSVGQDHIYIRCLYGSVGQNHIYTVSIRYFWQGNHQKYGRTWCMFTVMASPKNDNQPIPGNIGSNNKEICQLVWGVRSSLGLFWFKFIGETHLAEWLRQNVQKKEPGNRKPAQPSPTKKRELMPPSWNAYLKSHNDFYT